MPSSPQYLDDYKPSASGAQPDVDIAKLILYTQANVRGVVCGPRLLFEQMIRAHEQAYLRAGMQLLTDSTEAPLLPDLADNHLQENPPKIS